MAGAAAAAPRLSSAASRAARSSPPQTVVPLTTPPLAVLNFSLPAEGIFDPSLIIEEGGAATLAFSAVTATASIATRVAAWDGRASAWRFLSSVNEAQPPSMQPCAGGPCPASLIHEVPSLLLDPTDPNPLRRWKVFAHTYLVTGDSDLHYDWGVISLFTAPAPQGPWAARPLLGWRGASPLSTAGVAQVLTDTPALADCLAFTEPGAASNGTSIALALGCVSEGAGGPQIRVVLLASGDHGGSWAYRGVAVDGADAGRLGFAVPELNAADLFFSPAGQLLLSVTPAAQLWPGFVGYCGCLVLAVLPDGSGVARGADGAPVVLRSVVPGGVAFAGACTAGAGGAPAGVGGYMLPTLFPGEASPFRILESGVPPV